MTLIYPNLGHIYRRRTTQMLSTHSSGAIWYLPLSCNCMICVRRISRHDHSKNNNKLQIECIIDIFTWKPIQWSVALAFRWHKQQELRLNTALITNLASATPSSVESHLNCVWWLTFGQYAIPCAALRHSRLCQNIHIRHSSELNNNNNVWTQFGSKTNHKKKIQKMNFSLSQAGWQQTHASTPANITHWITNLHYRRVWKNFEGEKNDLILIFHSLLSLFNCSSQWPSQFRFHNTNAFQHISYLTARIRSSGQSSTGCGRDARN